MLTRRGVLVIVAGVGLAGLGRLLGIVELFAAASAMIALALASYAYVRLTAFSIDATRQLRPPRVHAGGASRVELTVANTGERRSPVLVVRDPFDGGRRWARFPLAPLGGGERARAAYRLPTDERGIFTLGPLEVVLTDPFGLATHSRNAASSTTLTVYPHVDPIAPMPSTTGHDPTASTGHPNALSLSGDEFYALREYQVGDDLRRVHWPSTARLDELMIRQDELPWHGRASVLVDMRRQVHATDTFEMALSAAASIVNASFRARGLVRLVATNGYDSDFNTGQGHLDAIYEHLAAAHAHSGDADLATGLALLRRRSHGGSLAVVTTSLTVATDLHAIARLRHRYGTVIVVLVEPTPVEGAAFVDTRHLPAASGTVVRVKADGSFPSAWNRAILMARTGRLRDVVDTKR